MSELTELLSELLIKDNPDLPDGLKEEQKKLDKIKCIDLQFGKWIDDNELPVLLELLDSPDSYFYKHYPQTEPFPISARQAFAEQIQSHLEVCEHCIMKVNFDNSWEIKVNAVAENHREKLKRTASAKVKATKVASRGKTNSVGA